METFACLRARRGTCVLVARALVCSVDSSSHRVCFILTLCVCSGSGIVAIIFATVRCSRHGVAGCCFVCTKALVIRYPKYNGIKRRKKTEICSRREKGKQSRKYHHPVRGAGGRAIDTVFIYNKIIYLPSRARDML